MQNRTLFEYENHSWRKQAEALFFIEHMKINEIVTVVQKSRQAVSGHITSCEGYDDEMKYRSEQSKAARKEYQRQWDRDNRSYLPNMPGPSLRQEHEMAVKILSAEKY